MHRRDGREELGGVELGQTLIKVFYGRKESIYKRKESKFINLSVMCVYYWPFYENHMLNEIKYNTYDLIVLQSNSQHHIL